MAKTLILLIALLACAAETAVPGLTFESADGTTCLIKKDGNDIVGACDNDGFGYLHSAFKTIISGDTVQDPAIPVLEDAVKNLHNAFCADVLHSTTTPAYGGKFTHSKNDFCQYNCVAGEYSRAGNEDILIGDPGSKCPEGYSSIQSGSFSDPKDVCKLVAMKKLGLSSSDSPVDEFHTETKSDWPSGCYFLNGVHLHAEDTYGTWYNYDTTLSKRAGVQLYCAKDSWAEDYDEDDEATDPVVKEDKCMTCRTECDAVGYLLGVDCDGTTTDDRPCTQCLFFELGESTPSDLPDNAVWISKEDCSWDCDDGFTQVLNISPPDGNSHCELLHGVSAVSDCTDDPDWLFKTEKNCAWTEGKDSRCLKEHGEDGSTGYESCRSSCGCANSEAYHDLKGGKDGCVDGC